jgi:6-phosphogluconolactonase/glucosamine-6-phosphate isomerase/deaminase
MEHGAQSISTEINEETSEEVRIQWEVSLRVWKSVHQDGVVLATMGVGLDGHTAGIFPRVPEVDMSGESLIVAYTLPEGTHQYAERITTTFTFLMEWVDEAIVYVVGEEKREVFMRLEKGTETREEMPACVFHEMRSVKLFTDIDT